MASFAALNLRRPLIAGVSVALALADPTAHLDLRRPIVQTPNVLLALGTPSTPVVIPPVTPDYPAALRLRAQPAKFRASAIQSAILQPSVVRLRAQPAKLRASAVQIVTTYTGAVRLRSQPAQLHSVAFQAPQAAGAVRLLAQAVRLRAIGRQTEQPYLAAIRLAGGASSLRAIGRQTEQPYGAAVRLRTPPSILRAAARPVTNTVNYSTRGAWRDVTPRFGDGWTFPWGTATKQDLALGIGWGPFVHADEAVTLGWAKYQQFNPKIGVVWGPLTYLNVKYQMLWTSPAHKDLELSSGWGPLTDADIAVLASWNIPPFKDRAWEIDWRQLASYVLDREALIPYFYPPQKDRRHMMFPWGPGGPPDYSVHYGLPPVFEPTPTLPRGSYVCMNLSRPLSTDPRNVQLRLHHPLRTYCDTGTFIVNNSINIITLIDGANLECTAVSLKLDITSFAWDISLTLATSAEFVRVKPSPAEDGAREVQITINGYVWRGFIDTVSLTREFGNPSYTAQGKSFSAYGAAPFAPLTSNVSTSDELTQQLANDVFQYTGFTITWDAVDWVVPAGLLAYENKDPMSVVAQICEAGGMFILPGRYDKSFIVRSRYPVTIWHWDDPSTPTVAHIALNQMISGSSRFAAGTDFTKVYVGGTQIGNTVGCTRDGTDGSSLAPAITNALLATDDAAIERGRIELCRGGARIFNTYVTPLVAVNASGMRLREVGELVAVDEAELDDNAYNGLITSVQIVGARTGVGELTVYQTLEVERHV